MYLIERAAIHHVQNRGRVATTHSFCQMRGPSLCVGQCHRRGVSTNHEEQLNYNAEQLETIVQGLQDKRFG